MPLDLLDFTLTQFQLFLLVVFRISGMVLTAPFFGNAGFHPEVRVPLAVAMSLVLFPLIQTQGIFIPQSLGAFLVVASLELFVGIMLGFVATFIFAGIQLGGQLVSQQMGITIADVIDPVSNTSLSIIAQYQMLYVSLLFVALGGPHYLVAVMLKSFASVPLTGFVFHPELVQRVSGPLAGDMFVLAVKSGAPTMTALLVSTIAMGFIARTVPEMNIFIIGFTIRLGMGLVVLWMTVDMFTYIFRVYMHETVRELSRLLPMLG